MGLFRRKNDDDEQRIVELRMEIRLLRQRLDEADAEKARIEARVDETDASKALLEQEVQERAGSIEAMNRQLSSQAGDVDALSSRVQALTDRLSTPPAEPPPPPPDDGRVDGIERRLADLDSVNDRLDSLSSLVAQEAHEALANTDDVDPAQIGDMANRLEDLSLAVATHSTQLAATSDRVDAIEQADETADADEEAREAIGEMRQQLGQMAERMTSLDRRLTNVSTELANQLTELSRDIDVIGESGDRPAASSLPPPLVEIGIEDLDTDELELRLAEKFDMAIDEVRASQERLATEQARYEIKFREDLADLADRLRRPRPTT